MSDNKDLRSPLAVARDEYIVGPGLKHCDPSTLGATSGQRQYLTNRIESAFLAGAKYSDAQLLARCAELEKVTESLLKEASDMRDKLIDSGVTDDETDGIKDADAAIKSARAALSPNPEAKP